MTRVYLVNQSNQLIQQRKTKDWVNSSNYRSLIIVKK